MYSANRNEQLQFFRDFCNQGLDPAEQFDVANPLIEHFLETIVNDRTGRDAKINGVNGAIDAAGLGLSLEKIDELKQRLALLVNYHVKVVQGNPHCVEAQMRTLATPVDQVVAEITPILTVISKLPEGVTLPFAVGLHNNPTGTIHGVKWMQTNPAHPDSVSKFTVATAEDKQTATNFLLLSQPKTIDGVERHSLSRFMKNISAEERADVFDHISRLNLPAAGPNSYQAAVDDFLKNPTKVKLGILLPPGESEAFDQCLREASNQNTYPSLAPIYRDAVLTAAVQDQLVDDDMLDPELSYADLQAKMVANHTDAVVNAAHLYQDLQYQDLLSEYDYLRPLITTPDQVRDVKAKIGQDSTTVIDVAKQIAEGAPANRLSLAQVTDKLRDIGIDNVAAPQVQELYAAREMRRLRNSYAKPLVKSRVQALLDADSSKLSIQIKDKITADDAAADQIHTLLYKYAKSVTAVARDEALGELATLLVVNRTAVQEAAESAQLAKVRAAVGTFRDKTTYDALPDKAAKTAAQAELTGHYEALTNALKQETLMGEMVRVGNALNDMKTYVEHNPQQGTLTHTVDKLLNQVQDLAAQAQVFVDHASENKKIADELIKIPPANIPYTLRGKAPTLHKLAAKYLETAEKTQKLAAEVKQGLEHRKKQFTASKTTEVGYRDPLLVQTSSVEVAAATTFAEMANQALGLTTVVKVGPAVAARPESADSEAERLAKVDKGKIRKHEHLNAPGGIPIVTVVDIGDAYTAVMKVEQATAPTTMAALLQESYRLLARNAEHLLLPSRIAGEPAPQRRRLVVEGTNAGGAVEKMLGAVLALLGPEDPEVLTSYFKVTSRDVDWKKVKTYADTYKADSKAINGMRADLYKTAGPRLFPLSEDAMKKLQTEADKMYRADVTLSETQQTGKLALEADKIEATKGVDKTKPEESPGSWRGPRR